MSIKQREIEKEIAHFNQQIMQNRKRGIFTTDKRNKIMGTKGISGKGIRKADFWQDVRDHVRAALIDLELFLTFASENDISLVMTGERLYPIIDKLASAKYPVKPDLRIADIANIMIQTGFKYLYYSKSHDITLSHKRTINEALDLANFLVQSYLPLEKRQYVSGNAIP